jgi:flagellar hook-basal body complex protein FliE
MDSVKLSAGFINKLQNDSLSRKLNVKTESKTSFGEMLKETINEVDTANKDSDAMINGLASGKNTDIHNTMIAIEKADISFQLMMQIRNKLIAAYQEIYRMQI